MTFPEIRPRRMRRNDALRRLASETDLDASRLIAPFFVKEGIDEPAPVASMPGVSQQTEESLVTAVKEAAELGIGAVILFGIPTSKDALGSEASNRDGVVQRAVRSVKDSLGDDLVVITDLCLDEFTDHGHCGVLTASGEVDNDATLERYREIAVTQAAAGADVVAPSGMMDGQVAAIRDALDTSGHSNVAIMSYAAKFASAFYGPFRDAAECAPEFGDRRSYQIDPSNVREALREVKLDEEEGADIVMVKPAGPYLDVIYRVRQETNLPVAAYQVSGEYAALHASGLGAAAIRESLISIRRAGAEMIITYFALAFARGEI